MGIQLQTRRPPLYFLSRHSPTDSQQAFARSLGYSGLRQINLHFGKDPVKDLEAFGIYPPAEISAVGPGHVTVALLRAGFVLIEFENSPQARRNNQYECSGAYRLTLDRTEHIPLQTTPARNA